MLLGFQFRFRVFTDLNADIDKAAVHIDIPDKAVTESTVSKGNAASEQCLNLELNQDMDSLIASARQIFITMPAKASGTSM